ncbi:MAG: N(4)-(beta-N-acetylglucosaminyl)-L-asparaginase [Verrucomicrobiota bacterium]|nr:N(4)-(beta-N-acetylglucosaminyl)-L-asparaginase [Verrucomicrobiota bacterium]
MNNFSRRNFLRKTSIAAATTSLGMGCSTTYRTNLITNRKPVIISTWAFGKPANELALQILQDGGSALDAVEQGIRLVESSGNTSVGLSGKPNAAGVPQLDACIMNGPGHSAGSVAGIEGVVHPITAARLVMEKTPHVMLVGQGARWFSEQQGLKIIDNSQDEKRYAAWLAKQKNNSQNKVKKPDNHDTVTLIVLDNNGDIAGGCSTSGLSGKIPGRVGDSPIIGSGLYVDNEVGAAGATGLGENVMRYCASYQVVENMRQGMSPTEACSETIKRIARTDPLGMDLGINFIAINKQGEFGAAGTQANFPYSITTKEFSEVRKGQALSNAHQKEGGNER